MLRSSPRSALCSRQVSRPSCCAVIRSSGNPSSRCSICCTRLDSSCLPARVRWTSTLRKSCSSDAAVGLFLISQRTQRANLYPEFSHTRTHCDSELTQGKASSMPTSEYIEKVESNDAESICNDLIREAARH